MKIKIATVSRYIYYLTIAIVLISLGANFVFLYNGFYRTIVQSEVIYILSGQVSFEMIDINIWNKVTEQIEHKKNPTVDNIYTLKNPFSAVPGLIEE